MKQCETFLRNWELPALERVANVKSGTFGTYRTAAEYVIDAFSQKIDENLDLKLTDGGPLIISDTDKNSFQSYVHWKDVMKRQNEFDLVITNTFILYDDLSRPFPHTIFKHAKAGGSSFTSPNRPGGFTAMTSTFELVTDMPRFRTERVVGLSASQRNKIIGAFLLAHEIGHMVFQIPDVYDHDPSCLMNSSFETLDYVSGWKTLMKSTGACTKCKPWITSRAYYNLAERLSKDGLYPQAIDSYYKCLKIIEKVSDGIPPDYYKFIMGKVKAIEQKR